MSAIPMGVKAMSAIPTVLERKAVAVQRIAEVEWDQ